MTIQARWLGTQNLSHAAEDKQKGYVRGGVCDYLAISCYVLLLTLLPVGG
jgi:hypothetical protein